MNPQPRPLPFLRASGAALALLILGACATPVPQRNPLYTSAGFSPAAIDRVAVLTGADLRPDKSVYPKAGEKVSHFAHLNLRARHYQSAEVACGGFLAPNITEADLERPPVEWVKSLPAPEARWVCVVVVLDLGRKITFGSTANAEVAGYLYDRQTGEIVWHDKGVGRMGQGGLLGMTMGSAVAHDALAVATANLFTALPERAK